MDNTPYDSYCFFIHRLKIRTKVNLKADVLQLSKDSQDPIIVKLAQEINDASDLIDTYFFSEKARSLKDINRGELINSVDNYISMLAGLVGSKAYQPSQDSTTESAVAATTTNTINANTGDIQEINEDEIMDIENKKEKSSSQENNDKIRKNFKFTWTTVFGSERSTTFSDTLVEMMSVLFNLGVWYLGYSEYIISNKWSKTDGLSEDDRQTVYDFLLKAAGIFESLRGSMFSSVAQEDKCTDFSDAILRTLYLQSMAQAQEITVGRAFKKNTSASTITKLAVDTSSLYKEARDCLESNYREKMAEYRLEKFYNFIIYKISLYESLAYQQQAFALNCSHKYGEAIATAKKSQAILKKTLTSLVRPCVCITLSQETLTRPTSSLLPIIDSTLARLERENKIIGFQSIPDEISPLPEGSRLVKVRSYVYPPVNAAWTFIDNISSKFNSDKKIES
ncbi:hypothetical protein CYY_004745 [Polysphondylium violaceum]|uniref:BRO1 domain-containing protein n=1 Tax=Polysphondylium violaceum TaxID=133409 RepID=A0A8J4PU58_9MYCE|nr:hypothetical protein CYY_004745 [Polysphondylium violaceum]